MKKKNNGFTLVELMAVIVILAVIVLIAFNRIKNVLKKNNEDTIVANANVFVKAVNESASTSRITENFEDGGYEIQALFDMGLSLSGTKPIGGGIIIRDGVVYSGCLEYDSGFAEIKNEVVSYTKECVFIPAGSYVVFAYTGDVQTYKVLLTGKYKIELWGARGGNSLDTNNPSIGGNGGYTSGVIQLNEGDTLYIYVGGKGIDSNLNSDILPGGFNGGGASSNTTYADTRLSASGGGSTDVRLVNGNWNDSSSLASRIMVASGGGGAAVFRGYYNAGAAGGLTGLDGATGNSSHLAHGATQTSGGSNSRNTIYNGSFGKGGDGHTASNTYIGGGGGSGYYGGAAGSDYGSAGAGGSSYISGYTGCVAITSSTDTTPKSGCTNGTTDKSCSIHYSNKSFDEAIIKSGNESMPTFDGSSTMIGNSDNGYAKITYIE